MELSTLLLQFQTLVQSLSCDTEEWLHICRLAGLLAARMCASSSACLFYLVLVCSILSLLIESSDSVIVHVWSANIQDMYSNSYIMLCLYTYHILINVPTLDVHLSRSCVMCARSSFQLRLPATACSRCTQTLLSNRQPAIDRLCFLSANVNACICCPGLVFFVLLAFARARAAPNLALSNRVVQILSLFPSCDTMSCQIPRKWLRAYHIIIPIDSSALQT